MFKKIMWTILLSPLLLLGCVSGLIGLLLLCIPIANCKVFEVVGMAKLPYNKSFSGTLIFLDSATFNFETKEVKPWCEGKPTGCPIEYLPQHTKFVKQYKFNDYKQAIEFIEQNKNLKSDLDDQTLIEGFVLKDTLNQTMLKFVFRKNGEQNVL